MKFIDTHSHLYAKEFDEDRDEVVQKAIDSGVEKILLPNISSKYTQRLLSLCQNYPNNCFPMMGLHPCDVNLDGYEEEIEHVKKELLTKKYIAVGEIGIDLHWDKSTLEIQKKAFASQILLAKENNLPIVIHVRNSFDETINIVEKYNDDNLSGVFHCFTGNIKEANQIIGLNNFYIGIGGVLTFKNSNLDKTIKNINNENLILETDSPYLTPTPYRGTRNESKHIIEIAKKLAEIKNISIEEVSRFTNENANRLFEI
tara:strand:- start:409 stop:1182 length:774 start_codon:yes stop_codon:yes gene_type:complete